MALSQTDYKQILEYYKISIPISKKETKHLAEQIIAEKMCKCIKKIEPENQCITRYKVQCHKRRIITIKKKTRMRKPKRNNI